MNISFTGSHNHASVFSLSEIKGQSGFSHKLICTLDNEGKTRHLYNFEPLLDEYALTKNKAKNNVLIVEVFNKIKPIDILEIKNNLSAFFANKYNPQGDLILINGKQFIPAKNKLYISQKIEDLSSEIIKKRNIDFYLSKDYIEGEDCISHILGENISIDKNQRFKFLEEYLSIKNIKFNAECILKSMQNLTKKL